MIKVTNFNFYSKVIAKADMAMNNQTVINLWHSFTSHASTLEVKPGKDNTFIIGDAELPIVLPSEDYAINITESGIAISANNYNGLVRGYTAMLRFIEIVSLKDGNENFKIQCRKINKEYKLSKRMIHYCVFPETTLLELMKEIRLAGILHYTHIVIEFWGMFKFDCLSELSWPNAFSKDIIKDIIREVRELGMEPIPFLNHLGHASMCRILSGKHVVLDQNPRLAEFFLEEGWEWNIHNEATINLLSNMRKELCEVFGKGEYFHIGCDEAHMITAGAHMSNYLSKLTNQVEKEGRKPLLWADMLMAHEELDNTVSPNSEDVPSQYFVACKTEADANSVLNSLSPNSILVDWQYETKHAPLKTFLILNNKGFNVIEAPWFDYDNIDAAIKTIEDYNGYGIMVTTWNNTNQSFSAAVYASKIFGGPQFDWSFKGPFLPWSGTIQSESATLIRKVTFEKVSYIESGFCKNQTGYTPK